MSETTVGAAGTAQNPFPGMNPYLESLSLWHTFHSLMAGVLTLELNRVLPPAFQARLEQRLLVTRTGETLQNAVADALVLRTVPPARSGGGAAVLEMPLLVPAAAPEGADLPLLFMEQTETVREPFVEIVVADTPTEVVTVIEILSPGNKAAGSAGRREYQRKQEAIRQSGTHLLEIDLLRGGLHTVAIGRESIAMYKPFDYVVCLHHALRGTFSVWPVTVREPLPRILIPLSEGVADCLLDLNAVMAQTYMGGRYHFSIDYRRDCVPPLTPNDAAWADALLKNAGLRPIAP